MKSKSRVQQVLDMIIAGQFIGLIDDYFEGKPEARDLLDAPEVYRMWENMLTKRGLNRHRFGTLAPSAPDERSAFAINLGQQCGVEAQKQIVQVGDLEAGKKWLRRGASLQDFWCQSTLINEFIDKLNAAKEQRHPLAEACIEEGVAVAFELAKYHYSIGFIYLSEILWRVAQYYHIAAKLPHKAQVSSYAALACSNEYEAKTVRFAGCAIAAIHVAIEIWSESYNLTRNCLFNANHEKMLAEIGEHKTRMYNNKNQFETDMLNSIYKPCVIRAVTLGKQIAQTIKQDGICRFAQL